jgi:hypothetical protein
MDDYLSKPINQVEPGGKLRRFSPAATASASDSSVDRAAALE